MPQTITSPKAVKIFSPVKEAVLILMPFAILALCSWEYLMNWSFSLSDKGTLIFLSNVVFLNSLHIIFTFQMAFTIPAYKAALISKRGRGWSVLIAIGVLAIAVKASQILSSGALQKVFEFSVLSYSFHHIVKQTFGFSMIYNQLACLSKSLSPRQCLKIQREGHFERNAINVIIGLMIIHCAIRLYSEHHDWKVPALVNYLYIGAVGLLVMMIAKKYSNISWTIFKFKIFFLARILVFVASFFSFIGILGVNIVHGIEYYLIYKRVYGNAKATAIRTSMRAQIMVSSLALIVIGGSFAEPTFGLSVSHPLILAFNIGLGGLVLFHYYLDGVIFSMRRGDIRKETGQWLLSDSLITSTTREFLQDETKNSRVG